MPDTVIEAFGRISNAVLLGGDVLSILVNQVTSARDEVLATADALALDVLTLQQGLGADVWADQVSGSDASTGLSAFRAKQTLVAAEALLTTPNLTSLALYSNSFWRETLDLTDDFDVVAFGAGDPPIIDASEIVTGWTEHATQANLWEKSFTHEASGNTSARIRVWGDGVPWKRKDNDAAANAAPLSFVQATANNGPTQTIKINPGVGVDPNTSGVLIEVVKREAALISQPATDITVRGPLVVRRALTNNGPCYILDKGTISQILSIDGTKHNFLIGRGSTTDCIAWRADPPFALEASQSFFVGFLQDPTGEDVIWTRSGCVQPVDMGDPAYPSGITGWIAHSGTVGPRYASVILRQCWAVGPVGTGHAGGGVVQVEEGCYWRGTTVAGPVKDIDIRYTLGYIPKDSLGSAVGTSVLDVQKISHTSYYAEGRTNVSPGAFRIEGEGGLLVDFEFNDSALVMGPTTDDLYHSGVTGFDAGAATGGTIKINRSCLIGWTGNLLLVDNEVAYVGDYNVFWFPNEFVGDGYQGFVWHGVAKTSLTDWQAATGQDANSCTIFRADQVAGNANAFYLGWAEALPGTSLRLCGPAVGDWRINPLARTRSAAGAAFIGTYPDGRSILRAGPQLHWDWNRREAVAGPSPRDPIVPVTEQECLDYIRNPRAWVF